MNKPGVEAGFAPDEAIESIQQENMDQQESRPKTSQELMQAEKDIRIISDAKK